MKKYILIMVVLAAIMSFATGCKRVTLSAEDEELFVAYAVDCVLKYDYNYLDKLLEVDTFSSDVNEDDDIFEDETTSGSDDNAGEDESGDNGDDGDIKDKIPLTQLMDIDGFSFEVSNYRISKKYSAADGSGLMTATDGKNLLAIEIKVTNLSSEVSKLNVIGGGYNFAAVINGSKKLNPQIWGNHITLNVFEGEFDGNESRILVLVFQVDETLTANSIKLSVSRGDTTGTVTVK